MRLVLCGIFCLLVSETYTQGFSTNNFNGLGNVQNHNSHLHAPSQQVNNPFRRQINDGFKPKQQQNQLQQQQHQLQQQNPFFVQQSQSIEVPFNQKNLINQRPPASQNRFSASNQFAPPQAKSNLIFQRSLENQLRIPQSPYQVLPSTQVSSIAQKDQDFHTQNFLALRNHVQNAGPTQQLPQRTQQQQFLQQPLQQQQQQQQPPFIQTQPQFSPKQKPQQPQAQQSSFNFQNVPITTGQFNFQPQSQQQQQQQQQQQTFQKLPQVVQQQQFQPVLQSTAQALPQTISGPSFNENIPKYQSVASLQQPQFVQPNLQFQAASSVPQVGQLQHSFTQPQFQPNHQQSQQSQFSTAPQIGRNTDQEYKQKLIQKHEQFVQKQYEKNQNKVQQLHQQFIQKQQQIKQQAPAQFPISAIGNSSPSRPLLPTETHLFESAVKKYHEEHPTTTTTTTTTTPVPETTLTYTNIFQNHPNRNSQSKPGKTFSNDEILKQLKAALSENSQTGLGNKTFDSMDLILANGQKVQVIRTTDPNLVKGKNTISESQLESLQSGKTSNIKFENLAPENKQDFVLSNGNKVQIVRAPNPDDIVGTANLPVAPGLDLSSLAKLYGGGAASSNIASSLGDGISTTVIQSDNDSPPTIEELAKRGLIPEGYEIEGLSPKTKSKPKSAAPSKKKPTYVYLEEQNDGSFKIQGVKANGEKETKTTGSEVEMILNRIRSGETKLPPTVKKLILPNDEEVFIDAIVGGGSSVSSTTLIAPSTTTARPFTTTRRAHVVRSSFAGTPTTGAPNYSYRTSGHVASASTTYQTTSVPRTSPQYISPSTYRPVTEKLTAVNPTTTALPLPDLSSDPTENLIQILKSKELYAMAKYLRQSGLDKILNETGPYTVFVPTDKAFKNLLVQLGGPERAEEKFKINPRLLSGLLLHHVIPGSFEISSLQDEMTGVSLAGTQLRVNQYTMHDQEWNDVTITTINGAMVLNDRKDIKIPQGIAHAVDRVMFPLPVGDLHQTLQSDRDGRFNIFLKIVQAADFTEKLQSKGVKTYTVFAPTEKAFEDLETDVITKLTTDKDAAIEFVEKHIVPGTLFSAGMRFYQVKDSLASGNSIILQKTSAGKIKVNETHMLSSNIPATNGVVHAIDGLL